MQAAAVQRVALQWWPWRLAAQKVQKRCTIPICQSVRRAAALPSVDPTGDWRGVIMGVLVLMASARASALLAVHFKQIGPSFPPSFLSSPLLSTSPPPSLPHFTEKLQKR